MNAPPTMPRGVAADRLEQYRRLVATLATAAARNEADLAAAERAYAVGVEGAHADLELAMAAAERAERAAASAATAVVVTDEEVERLWYYLRRTLGWRGALLGEPPAPAADLAGAAARPGSAGTTTVAGGPATARPGSAGTTTVAGGSATPRPGAMPADASGLPASSPLLSRAARRIAELRPDRPPAPLPGPVLPLLAVLGAAVATVVALIAGGLVTLGQLGSGLGPLRLAGYLTFLVAPFAGVPVAVVLLDRRYGSRLDTGGAALIVLGGMVAACAISVAIR